jgi:hypothetical protein
MPDLLDDDDQHLNPRDLRVPETPHTPSDLLPHRYRRPGMIPRWRCD